MRTALSMRDLARVIALTVLVAGAVVTSALGNADLGMMLGGAAAGWAAGVAGGRRGDPQ